jgi:serine/threonine protein kinase
MPLKIRLLHEPSHGMLSTGTKLGPYEITGTAGKGGMGEVYRARDTRLDRTVAIKVLPAELSADSQRRQRFETEARVISKVSHPHICNLLDVGQLDGVDYLVMEYLEGETLQERIDKGAIPLDLVLRYGSEIAEALSAAHRQGIVHRDLKPGNIMLTKSGSKLLDFGLARLTKDTSTIQSSLTQLAAQTTRVTEEGMILGTWQYMSPEQLEGKDARLAVRHLPPRAGPA